VSVMSLAFLNGLKHLNNVFAVVLIATFIGIGALCKGYGLSMAWTMVAASLMWAGPAQVILVSGMTANASLLALALTIGLSSVRMMPMVVSIMPLLRAGKPNIFALLFCAHIVSISTWVEGLRVLPPLPHNERVPFYMGLGVGVMVLSSLAAGFGFSIAGVIAPRFAAVLLFLTPLFFLITVLKGATKTADYLAISFGVGLFWVGHQFMPQFDLLFGGLVGGTLAFLLGKLKK
jgi:predicted branched-subunit amino acid permease